MYTIKLDKAVIIKEKEKTELNFDFEKLKGKDLLKAEKKARLLNPRIINLITDFTYLSQVASIAGDVPFYILEDLPARTFNLLMMNVANFLNVPLEQTQKTSQSN